MTPRHIEILEQVIAKGRIISLEFPMADEAIIRELGAAGYLVFGKIARRPPAPVIVVIDLHSRIEGRAALEEWKKKQESESPAGRAKALGKKALLLIGALIGVAATKLTEALVDHWLK